MANTDPTQRFSSRVENYIRYRPTYPKAILTTLAQDCQLTSSLQIADIGSGTGILTKLFLQQGNPVFAVEPNRDMRLAAERLLQPYLNFQSIEGQAETTTLVENSVDFVIAGQAFHWFNRHNARAEFRRILKPGGWVVLIWNDRETKTTPFLVAYEQLLHQYATDYAQVNHKHIDEAILSEFYGDGGFITQTFPNQQNFTFEGLKGRLLSSSYVPEAGHLNYEPMLAELLKIFQAHQVKGKVAFEYTTRLYYGQWN